MGNPSKYIPGTSHLVDYAIEHYGAEVIEEEYFILLRPPFPCLTGVSNTSDSFKIDQCKYPNIVAAGVDTIELNFGVAGYVQPDEFRMLDEAKLEAVSAGYKRRLGIPVNLCGQEFMVQPRGSKGGYEYVIKNGDIELQIMPDARGGKPSPELRAILRSSFIWREGDIQAYNRVIEFINNLAYIEYCNVSRADLCVDRVMTLPEIDRRTQVVSLLRERDIYYGGDFQRGQRKTGYQFGRGGMVGRFYDKTYENSIKGNSHIEPLWTANGWDGESPVSRFELQSRRAGLRLFDPTMDFATFQVCKSDIWSYGTDRLIRIVDTSSATRKERAKAADFWVCYQNCVELFGERLGVLPYKQVNSDWKSLVTEASGCLESAFARLSADVNESEAKKILEKEWGCRLPNNVIKKGLIKKARFVHMS